MRHCTQVLLPFLVRLACVRHAASVDSEPGSNSRLILVCSTQSGRRSDWSGVPRSLEKDRRVINSENDSTKVSRHLTTGTFNYVVKDPDCIRTRRAVLDQGPTPSKAQLCVLELDALGQTTLFSALGRFCANLLNLSNFLLHVKLLFRSRFVAIQPHS